MYERYTIALLSILSRKSNSMRILAESSQQHRNITQSCQRCGKRSRDPYDRRWGLHPFDVKKHGGTREMELMMEKKEGEPQLPGYYDKFGKFVTVPEMIPDFVVPDLTDVKMKPYVSYRVKEVSQSEFTALDLFNDTYAKEIVEEFKSGKIKATDVDKHINDVKAAQTSN